MKEAKIILNKIRQDGHRLTKVRKAMVNILLDQGCLLSSADILSQLTVLGLKADRSTVYRELCFLLEKNIIRKVRIADNKTHYEIRAGHHHHLVCTKCEKIKEIVLGKHLESQEKKIYKKEKFKVTSHSLEFYGLCGNCRAL